MRGNIPDIYIKNISHTTLMLMETRWALRKSLYTISYTTIMLMKI